MLGKCSSPTAPALAADHTYRGFRGSSTSLEVFSTELSVRCRFEFFTPAITVQLVIRIQREQTRLPPAIEVTRAQTRLLSTHRVSAGAESPTLRGWDGQFTGVGRLTRRERRSGRRVKHDATVLPNFDHRRARPGGPGLLQVAGQTSRTSPPGRMLSGTEIGLDVDFSANCPPDGFSSDSIHVGERPLETAEFHRSENPSSRSGHRRWSTLVDFRCDDEAQRSPSR